MTSIQGLLVGYLLRKNLNTNISNKKHSRSRHCWQKRFFNADRLPDTFLCNSETTPGGTAFQRVFCKETTPSDRLILYFHGGSYIAGLSPVYRNFAPSLSAAAGGCEVIYLDYRRAPQHLYPEQLTEAMDLWSDLIERQNYDPKQIIIGGDSAGANLCLALLLKLRDLQKPMPRAAFCLSAWTDMTCSTQSFWDNFGKDVMFGDKGKILTEERRQELLLGKTFCFIGDASRTDPYVSPIFGDYHGFPPMFFAVGSHEMLLDETLEIVKKLEACQVPVTCEIQPGMFHIYVIFARLVPEGRISYRRLLSFIQNCFSL